MEATQPTNVFPMLKWEHKLNQVYSILGKSKSSIIISKDKKSKNNPKVYKEFSYIPSGNDTLKSLIQTNHNLYEVLPSNLPRHFYIDCDIKEDNDLFSVYNYPKIIKLLTSGIFKIMQHVFQQDHELFAAFIVKNDTIKQSCHIIFPTINLKNVQDTKHFAMILKHYIEDEESSVIDLYEREILSKTMDYKVYSINQNFRLPLQTKLGKDDSYKLIPYTNQSMQYIHVGIYDKISLTFLDSLNLQHIACGLAIQIHNTNFPSVSNNKENGLFVSHFFDVFCNLIPPDRYTLTEIVDKTTDPVQLFVSCIPNSDEHPQHYSLWWSIGQTLKNISIGKSTIEQNEHLALWIKWSNQANTIYKNEDGDCRNTWKSMEVRTDNQKRFGLNFLQSLASFYYPHAEFGRFKNYSMFQDFVDIDKFFCRFNQVSKYNTDPTNLDTVKGYCRLLDFTIADIIVIIAAMGLGKTYVVNESIKANKFERILLISPRQTFCQEKVADLQSICPDFRSYLDEDVRRIYDWSMVDKLAIQVESLHKLINIDEYNKYDLLILDEIESILYQFSSETHSEPYRCFQVFMDLLATSGKIVMADAFITNRTMSLCSNVLVKQYKRHINVEINAFNPNGNINANIIGIARNCDSLGVLKRTFTNHMMEKLKANKKICVIVSSKLYKDHIIDETNQVLGYLPGVNILSYDRETSDEDINNLGHVKDIWGGDAVRLVIYTTKITVGINFDVMDKFDNIYIYGSIYCPIARDLMQSHFRVRNIRDKNIYVALNCCAVPEAIDNKNNCNIDFVKSFVDNIKNRFGFNAQYQDPITMVNYVNIAQYNYLEESIGYTLYDEVFKYFLKATGYNIVLDYECDIQIIAKHTNDDSLIPKSYITRYIEYRSMSTEQIKDIEIRSRLRTASTQDKVMLASYFFSRKYIYGKIDFISEKIQTYLLKTDEKYLSLLQSRVKALEITFEELVECEMFNQTREDKNIERILDNLMLEVSKKKISRRQGSEKVTKEQERYVMLGYITTLIGFLGLESSIDTTKVIGNKELDKFVGWFMSLTDIDRIVIIKLFCLRVKIDNNFGLDNKQQAITIISGMLYRWCGMRLNVTKTVMRPRIGKDNTQKRVFSFKCQIKCDLKKSMACYWLCYELMQEKMKAEMNSIVLKGGLPQHLENDYGLEGLHETGQC